MVFGLLIARHLNRSPSNVCHTIWDCNFLQTYRKQLDNIDINKFLDNLFRLKKKIEVEENLNQVSFAFIVFEAPTNPCSERWPIQDWLRANNIKIEEWSKK